MSGDLRKAAEQALEALEYRDGDGADQWKADVITTLRAALAEPEQKRPLSDEDAAALIALDHRILKEFGDAPSGAAMELIRAVERAHGIE